MSQKIGRFGFGDLRCQSIFNDNQNGRCLLQAAHQGLCINADGIFWDWRFPNKRCSVLKNDWSVLATMDKYRIRLPRDSNGIWSRSQGKEWRCGCKNTTPCQHINHTLKVADKIIMTAQFPLDPSSILFSQASQKMWWTLDGIAWLNECGWARQKQLKSNTATTYKSIPMLQKLKSSQYVQAKPAPLSSMPLPKITPTLPGATRNPVKPSFPQPKIPKLFISVKSLGDIQEIIKRKKAEAEEWKRKGNKGAVKDILIALEWDLKLLRNHPQFKHLAIPSL